MILDKEINIPKNALISYNGEQFKQEWFTDTFTIIIGIGKDNTAEFIIDGEALQALQRGEKIHIEIDHSK